MSLQTVIKACLCLVLLSSCSSSSKPVSTTSSLSGEYIYRHHGDSLVQVDPMVPQKRVAYPWEEKQVGAYPKITKDFFRCKGSSLHPVHLVQKEKELVRYYDCGGPQKHSLPLRDQKEFIYPILIDLLNYIQMKTNKRVVITCGHCCPDHNLYVDPSPSYQSNKHLIGAEVDFYVQGLEHKPEMVIDLILAYYRETPKYKGLKDFEEFKRYEKEDSKVVTPPWYNKEVFVKLFKKSEGRDLDNRHSYPYLSIQVRFDWDTNEKVNYSWDKAFRNFHRW
ncbi:conserved hypothetical protein [Candidatus Protochlamydia naegleriophila]|uniref:Uncharacterized protein n=1 Tax=Candidatus Protochlamydia naegleriophila TaxID=389348 RepID=A0A0U5JBD2_9BACT|nr:hypothetical protein [Candidatus Protochlamydia naegleriophila]CUI16100.1 conserved hypothetical protein [Candidatus Protochlamydia naegleriophila]